MQATTNSTYELEVNLTDTWQLGQHNYTISAYDGNNTNTSSQYSFNVSAQVNVSVTTENNSYGDNEYVNLTSHSTYGYFGNLTLGATSQGIGNSITGTKFTLSESATIDISLRAYI